MVTANTGANTTPLSSSSSSSTTITITSPIATTTSSLPQSQPPQQQLYIKQSQQQQQQQQQLTQMIRIEELDIRQFVPALASVLTQITVRNDRIPLSASQVTVFHALRPPAISIQAYLERLARYAYCSPECFVLAIIYLDRIIQKNQNFFFNSLNVHRLLITGVMIAAKFFDDTYYNNAYYARVGGIPTAELNTLEIKFLYLIDFNLHVMPEVFEKYKRELLTYSIPQQVSSHHQQHVQQQLQHLQQQAALGFGQVQPLPASPKSPLNLSDTNQTVRTFPSANPSPSQSPSTTAATATIPTTPTTTTTTSTHTIPVTMTYIPCPSQTQLQLQAQAQAQLYYQQQQQQLQQQYFSQKQTTLTVPTIQNNRNLSTTYIIQ